MIDGVELNNIIQSVVDENISLAFLLFRDGSVIALAESHTNKLTEDKIRNKDKLCDDNNANHSNDEEMNAHDERARLITAVANMLRAYRTCYLAKNRLTSYVEESALEMMIVNWKDRRLCVMTTVMQAAICLVTQLNNCEIGWLKLKTAHVQRLINAVLSKTNDVASEEVSIARIIFTTE